MASKPNGLSDSTYLRMQTVTDLGMDKVDPESIEKLQNAGKQMWDDNKIQAKKMIRTIVDERFGPMKT